MTIKFTAPKIVLDTVISAINPIATEAIFEFSAEGLRVNVVDPANVAMCNVNVPAVLFSEYDCDDSKVVFELNKMTEILKTASSDTEVSVELDTATTKLIVKVGGKRFKLGLIDPTAIKTPPRIPALNFSTAVKLTGSEFYDNLKAAAQIKEDLITLQTVNNTFNILCGGSIDSFEGQFDVSSIAGGDASADFSLEYMQAVGKAVSKVDITIELQNSYPTRLSTILDGVSVVYLLAPRLDESGDD